MPCLALVLESGVTNMTLKRTISGMIGTGSLAHNRREFIAENVDSDRVQLNICYQNENLKEVYKELFDEAVERYNIGKRKDRQITNYYEKIRQGKQEKLFHEVILQIGNREDMAVGTAEGNLAIKVLDEYVKDFQKRNPTLRVFGCYLHQDEATPHLHIDFIPYVTDWKGKGMDTRVSLKQALKSLGFQGGNKHDTELNQWMNHEKEILAEIAKQHGINNVLEPIFDKRFISQSYACRKGKGMHAASDTLKEWLYEWNKYHPDQPLYAIKADIHHYFQSIDHAVLKTEIRKVIKDAGVLALLDRIIDHNGNMPDGVGIPVGNLTSQLFANIYLDALDQFIKHELGVEAYIRYMDDFVILSPDKEQLRSWLARIEQFLREELKLEFNPKTTILAAKNGIDFVGYKHRATHRKVRKDSIKRIKRTIKKCESGKITKEQLQKSIQSWTGHAGHADSYNLRKKIETLAEAAIEKAA